MEQLFAAAMKHGDQFTIFLLFVYIVVRDTLVPTVRRIQGKNGRSTVRGSLDSIYDITKETNRKVDSMQIHVEDLRINDGKQDEQIRALARELHEMKQTCRDRHEA